MMTLLSDRPTDSYPSQMEEFGRFVGLWETHIVYYPAGGSPAREADGEWEFAYALEGRAVIDVWQVPGRRGLAGVARAANQECGLCVRIWDPRLHLWRFTFHSTALSLEMHMFCRQIGDEMVLESAEGRRLVRWIFSDVRADSFSWRSETSEDGGGTWRTDQRVHARRVVEMTPERSR